MYVLKNLKRLDRLPDKLREKIFEKIFSVAEIAKLSQEEYQQYIVSLTAYRDFKNSIDTARDEGKIEGKLEVAKELKALGVSFEQISIATKISIEEIEKL
jgi:predicted transposase/invertase (TIGR01784 family)